MANRKDDIKAHLLATFRVEAEEHLQAITANLLALDRSLPPGEARTALEATFREMHTLKGAARSVSMMEVEALCQGCESVLSRITRGQVSLSRPILNSLHQAVDGLARLLSSSGGGPGVTELVSRLEQSTASRAARSAERVEAAGDQAEAPAAKMAPGSLTADTIRVSTAKLDALLLQAEELLVPKLAARERLREARALVEALSRCRKDLREARATQRASQANGPYLELLPDLESKLQTVDVEGREMLRHLVQDQRTVATAVDSLLDEMRRLRMTPASAILDLFPKMVRDLASEQGKEVEWAAQGTDLEVDRKVLEEMKEPLIHLVRNAIDHGIETPEARQQAGKPLPGRLTVVITSLEGGRIEIRVQDDGGGIDLDHVKAAALRARLLSAEEAETLPEDQALDLVFRSGLSTSPIITDVSGHGLGLPIVKERVERLGGQIRLETRADIGTTVRMILPSTVAAFRGLLVRVSEQPFLLPIESVERIIRVAPQSLESVEGRDVIRWEAGPLPVAPLGRLLGLPERDGQPEQVSQRPCVVARLGEDQIGLLVDEILGDQEVLVKEFGPPLVRIRNVAGAGLLGTGQVALILRPGDLVRSMRADLRPAAPATSPEEAMRPLTILVVDDSITTRTMEKNILEAEGYPVRVAVDGLEAWTILKSESIDLVVSDVDMPRMDGFELTARIRADRKLVDLPVVLVTALESQEDKERGIEVGANAYVVKSSFDQSNLLEIIRRLA